MKESLDNHVRSDKAKWIVLTVVFALIVIMLVGMCLQLFGEGKVKPSAWGKKTDVKSGPTPLEVGQKFAITENTEGMPLYINTDENVWKEFFAECAGHWGSNEQIFFPAFGTDVNSILQEGQSKPDGVYLAKDNYAMPFLAFLFDGQDEYPAFGLAFLATILISDTETVKFELEYDDGIIFSVVDESGRLFFTNEYLDSLPNGTGAMIKAMTTFEYFGFAPLIYGANGEQLKLDDGTPGTWTDYATECKSEMVAEEWFNKLLSTTPFNN